MTRHSEPLEIPSTPAPPRRFSVHWCWQAMGMLKLRILLVAVGSALLSGAASSYFMARESEQVVRNSFSQQQQDSVYLVADLVDTRLRRMQSNLRLLAADIPSTQLAHPAALAQLLRNHPLTLEQFLALQVVLPDGSVLASASHSPQDVPDPGFSHQAVFQTTLLTGAIGISEPVRSQQTQEPVVVVTVPVRGPDGQTVAVLAGAVSLGSADLLPAAVSTLGDFSAVLVIYSRAGVILSHPDAQHRMLRAADEPGLGPLLAQRQSGGSVDQPHYLVATADVPAAGWTVARITSADYALAPLRQVHARSWLVVLGIMGICAALSTLLIANITRPITQLRDRAQRLLGAGRAVSDDWPRARGEIGQLVQVFRHVTLERGRAQAAQSAMVEQLMAILKNSPVGIVITRDSRFELVGSHANYLFGYPEGELLGLDAGVIYPSHEAYLAVGERYRAAFKTQGSFDGDVQMRRKDGSSLLVRMRGRGVIDGDPSAGVIWILNDVTAARARIDELAWSATHDSLTHLVNRRDFEARLAHAVEQTHQPLSRQTDYQGCCAMFIDLDYFKAINDAAGHAAGDEVLRQIARLLESLVRQSDTVARLGGDEFAILLPGCTLKRAQKIAEQVRAGVFAWRMDWREHAFHLGASIGVVQLSPELPEVAAVLEAADSACYEAKRSGRNRVVTYGEPLEVALPQ
ncbi:MAG: diguanylate cyclase [Rhodoferax sp.]|uniref:sensor domain-containing diguanylate cyclase n=1 Tax=Rhodoferax sp. TaxID=50421 RepID=UPI003266BA81